MRYCDFFAGSCVAEELELAPPEGCEELSLDGAAELEELDGDEELEPDGELVAPEPAEPLVPAEPLDGAALEDDDAPPALSFFWMSTEVDEELEPEPEGAVLGAAVEPDGEVVLEELEAPAGARLLSLRSQPVRTAAPNARETARARVDTFMWPPWLG